MTRSRALLAVKLALVAGIVVGLVGRATRPDPSAELVRATLESHRAGRERTRTLRANYTITHTTPASISGSGRYLWTPELSLTRNSVASPTVTETQVRGDLTRTLRRKWSGDRPGAVIEATTTAGEAEPGATELWRGLLLAATQGDRHVPVEEFVAQSRGRAKAKVVGVEGAPRVAVTVPEEVRQGAAGLVFQPETTFEFDPSVSHLVRKLTQLSPTKGGSILVEAEVLAFAEPAPGLFVPSKVRERNTLNGVVNSDTLITLSDIEVNAPIAPAELALSPIPAGTVVHDHTARLDVPVDAEWTPSGPAVPNFTRRGPPPAPVAVSPRRPLSIRPFAVAGGVTGGAALLLWLATRPGKREAKRERGPYS